MSMPVSEQDREALRQVALGLDVAQFLRGTIGRYLVERAEAARAAALDQLASVDPEDAKAIRHLQNEVALIDTLQQWLADAISEGEAAEQQLYEQQEP